MTATVNLDNARKFLETLADGIEGELDASQNAEGREVHQAFVRGYRAAANHLRLYPVAKAEAQE